MLVVKLMAVIGEVVVAVFAVILTCIGLNEAATNFYSVEQG